MKCGDCGWWVSNPIQPEKVFGFCTEEEVGILTDKSPVKRRSQTCRKWVSLSDVKPIYHDKILTNEAPEGCSTCPAKANVYKSPLCLKSTFISVDSSHLHYRKCSLMTPAMCRYGRIMDAMKKHLSEMKE